MSLYDGIPLDDLSTSSVMTSIDDNNSGGSDAKRAKKAVPTTTADNNSSGGWSSGLKLLQSQMQLKRAQATLTQRDRSRPAVQSMPSPVVDLTARIKEKAPTTDSTAAVSSLLKPRKPFMLVDGPPLSFIIPKAVRDDKVWLFGEILIDDEYNPLIPNDYETCRRRREQERMRLKLEQRQRQTEERNRRLNEQRAGQDDDDDDESIESQKRLAGAAIAPPPQLIAADSRTLEAPVVNAARGTLPSFGSGPTKGFGVAAKIMSRMGYKEGSGLGRQGQGITAALMVEQIGRGGGRIINEGERAAPSPSPPPVVPIAESSTTTTSITDALKNATKIVLLRNMAIAEELDDDLEPEVRDEMQKYGQVNKVVIFKMPNALVDDSVRIFVEFTNVAQAIKAVVDLNGRFFAGRSIRATFYSLDAYTNMDYLNC